jgi:hypothetical protein
MVPPTQPHLGSFMSNAAGAIHLTISRPFQEQHEQCPSLNHIVRADQPQLI